MSNKMDKEISELLLKNAFEEYENARCDEIIEKYKDTEPEYSEEHKRRMEKLFKKEKHAFSWKKGLMRAAMIILAVFICGSMALQVEAFRIQIKNWYYEITGEALHIGNSIEDLPGYAEAEMPVYVLSDEFIEKYGLNITQEIGGRIISTYYENLNNFYISIVQYQGDTNLHIDYDNENVTKEKVGRREILVIEKEELTIIWEDEDCLIYVYSNCDYDYISEIVKNIVTK